MPTRYDFIDLLLVTKIAESKSLSQGALKAHLSTPAASQRIKLLEESLGVQLLYRKSQGVTLTPCGEAFARHARDILQQLENLDADVRDYATGAKGKLRIWASTMAFEYLPEIVEQFATTRLSVDIELRERKSLDIVRAAAEGRIDIGVISGPADSEDVQLVTYRDERMVLVTPLNHDLSGRKAITFEETLSFPFVGLWEENNLRPFLAQEASHHGAALRVRIEASNFETACSMIEANVGIAVMPEKAARRYARDFDIRIVDLTDAWAVRKLKICTSKLLPISPLGQEFMQLLLSDPNLSSRTCSRPALHGD